MKITISQELLVDIDPTLSFLQCFLYDAIFFLQFGIPRWPPFAVTKIAQNMKMTVCQYVNNRVMDFDQICVKMILTLSCFKI